MRALDLTIDEFSEAGALCLDFANTAEWHRSNQPTETLYSYADLLGWAQSQRILSVEQKTHLENSAIQRPLDAKAALEQALSLREVIYQIMVASIKQLNSSPADLAALNLVLADALLHIQLIEEEKSYSWIWDTLVDSLTAPLRPVVLSAANLLTSDRLANVKQCEDDRGCGYLFIDTSKNRSRRWCSMESCGNRAKVRRHRQREQTKE